MKAVERADQLPSEHFEAVERAALLAAEVEAGGTPMRMGIARVLPKDFEVGFPFGTTVVGADWLRQRRVECVVRGNPEQVARRIIDVVLQLLGLIVGEQPEGLQAQLLLDRGNGGQMAEDDQVHAPRINEIRACSKVNLSKNPQVYVGLAINGLRTRRGKRERS